MNREVLFRGKAIAGFHTGKFVYGYLVKDYWYQGDCGIHPIDQTQGGYIEVNPETVGQYTGLTDKNGKKVFEGDIVKYTPRPACTIIYKVIWQQEWSRFSLEQWSTHEFKLYEWAEQEKVKCCCEVIDNIHDNAELLNIK